VTGINGARLGTPTFTYYSGTTTTSTALSGAPTNPGTYTVVGSYAGSQNYIAATAHTTFTIQPRTTQPITVSSFMVNDGSAQRSMVDSLTINFSAPVTLGAGAITLKTTSGVSVPFTLSTTDHKTYVLTFTGSYFIGHSLENGQYVLMVNHTLATGQSGGAMTASQSFSFFRLFGDSNGDGRVNGTDLNAFIKAFFAQRGSAKYAMYWYFDYADNGVINFVDLTHFLADF
jgi:hypothetical protein